MDTSNKSTQHQAVVGLNEVVSALRSLGHDVPEETWTMVRGIVLREGANSVSSDHVAGQEVVVNILDGSSSQTHVSVLTEPNIEADGGRVVIAKLANGDGADAGTNYYTDGQFACNVRGAFDPLDSSSPTTKSQLDKLGIGRANEDKVSPPIGCCAAGQLVE